jgi:predicted dehydrogenase
MKPQNSNHTGGCNSERWLTQNTMKEDLATRHPVARRTFLKAGAVLAVGLTAPSFSARAQANKNSRLRILQIGAGGIGGMQRGGLKGHPMVELAGFCDVDKNVLDKVASEYPGAFKATDYREVFANRVDQFDAVIVDTPDFHHAPMMLTAMQHNKHIYGQKPLVHQLSELRMIRDGLKARPDLVTQMGNQRACEKGRMQAAEILKHNQLGRPVEGYVWTGGPSKGDGFPEAWKSYPPAKPVPDQLNWDLWLGPLTQKLGYNEALAPGNWRDFWETGTGQLGDWGCHLLDLFYFAYDLPAPEAVLTHTIRPSNTGHSAHDQSTITYPGGGRFAREKFVIHYNDNALKPSFAALGLPPSDVRSNYILVVCEEGALLVEAAGHMTVYRKGKEVEDEPMPAVAPRNHWKDWADTCLGNKKPLWAPFNLAWRITEPVLLAVKATRFPGQELLWDSANFRFTNHDQANQEILSRNYREGFAPPKVG